MSMMKCRGLSALSGLLVFVLANTVTAAEGPAMLPIFGEHSRQYSSEGTYGWQFAQEADGYAHPITWVFHPGWDFNLSNPNDQGQNVYAIADGTVILDEDHVVDGNANYWGVLEIDHTIDGQHFYSQYGHVKEIYVFDGQEVKKGNRIAKVGNIGSGTSYHLHWEIRIPGTGNHPAPADPHYWQSTLQNLSNVQTWYRDPEQFVTRLDMDYERNAQGASNYGTMQNDLYWWYDLSQVGYYDQSTHIAKSCYLQRWSGGAFSDCGIVFDALGGARTAYTVRTGFWKYGQYGGWEPTGGPGGSLGMPITNEYNQGGSTARQDFQMGYLYWDGTDVTTNYYPHCSPGWTTSGWNSQYSYLFARAYERNGARNSVGEATEVIQNNWQGTAYSVQHFGNGDRMIVYDPDNADDNPYATNEAYYLYGDFYTYWTSVPAIGPWVLGAPTRDRSEGTQLFKYGHMVDDNGIIRAYNADDEEIWNNQIGGVGGFYASLSGTDFTPLVGNFNDDSYQDVCLYERVTGNWYVALNSGTNTFIPTDGPHDGAWLDNWADGSVNSNLVFTGDFNGDGLTDVCRFETSTGNWYVCQNNGENEFVRINGPYSNAWIWNWGDGSYGTAIPLIGNFNDDIKTDIAIFVPATGNWYVAINNGSNEFVRATGPYSGAWITGYQEGSLWTAIPITGNFGGSSLTDIGIFQPASGDWRVALNNGSNEFVRELGPYDGAWIDNWEDGAAWSAVPLVAKLNTDGWKDIMIFQPSSGDWRVALNNGDDEFVRAEGPYEDAWIDNWEDGTWGTYVPMPGKFNGDDLSDIMIYEPETGEWRVAFHNGSDEFVRETGPYDGAWLSGWGVETGTPKIVAADVEALPMQFSLCQNYPNPFNPSTVITYSLPAASHVRLTVVNILGQTVQTIVDGPQTPGNHIVSWDASRNTSGVYLYRLESGGTVETRKMLLLK